MMDLAAMERLRDSLKAMIDEVSRHSDHLLAAHLSHALCELDQRIESTSRH